MEVDGLHRKGGTTRRGWILGTALFMNYCPRTDEIRSDYGVGLALNSTTLAFRQEEEGRHGMML
jgi:hypothetical protein